MTPLIADRHLYLDKGGNKVVEHGDTEAASQLVAAGHPISQADADRLGLTLGDDDKVVQDHPARIADLRESLAEAEAERDELAEKIKQYRTENAVKDIPNTMEKARVDLDAKVEEARLNLAQSIKASVGKDPLKGESQATSVAPEKSEVAASVAPTNESTKKSAAKKAAKSSKKRGG